MTTTAEEAEKQPTEKRFYPIEPSTGLPFLPQGYWWEVEDEDPHGYYDRRYVLHIKTTVEVEEVVTHPPRTFWQGFFGRTPEPVITPAFTREVSSCLSAFYDYENAEPKKYITPVDISNLAQDVAHRFYESKRTEALAKESVKLVGKYPPLSVNAL